ATKISTRVKALGGRRLVRREGAVVVIVDSIFRNTGFVSQLPGYSIARRPGCRNHHALELGSGTNHFNPSGACEPRADFLPELPANIESFLREKLIEFIPVLQPQRFDLCLKEL